MSHRSKKYQSPGYQQRLDSREKKSPIAEENMPAEMSELKFFDARGILGGDVAIHQGEDVTIHPVAGNVAIHQGEDVTILGIIASTPYEVPKLEKNERNPFLPVPVSKNPEKPENKMEDMTLDEAISFQQSIDHTPVRSPHLEQKKMRLVCYGKEHFDPNLFKKAEDTSQTPYLKKPSGGLWASPEDTVWGWKEWSEVENFHVERLEKSFVLIFSGNIITIDSLDDLDKLSWVRKSMLNSGYFEHPTFNQLLELGVDAIHLTAGGEQDTRLSEPRNLYGWDCETVLVLNPDSVKEVPSQAEIEKEIADKLNEAAKQYPKVNPAVFLAVFDMTGSSSVSQQLQELKSQMTAENKAEMSAKALAILLPAFAAMNKRIEEAQVTIKNYSKTLNQVRNQDETAAVKAALDAAKYKMDKLNYQYAPPPPSWHNPSHILGVITKIESENSSIIIKEVGGGMKFRVPFDKIRIPYDQFDIVEMVFDSSGNLYSIASTGQRDPSAAPETNQTFGYGQPNIDNHWR